MSKRSPKPKKERPAKVKKERRVKPKLTAEEKQARRLRRRKTVKEWTIDLVMYIAGSFIFAASVNIFTAPNDIAPGGLTGVATMLNSLFGLPIGTTIWVLNVPLFIAAWFRIGKEFTVRTLIATTLSSVIIDLSVPWMPAFPGTESNMILVALFGGVLAGVGLGLIYMREATTGGTEIIARLLERHFRHIPIGRLLFVVDAVVVAVSVFVYHRVEIALYATVDIFVTGLVIDRFMYGADSGKCMMIISREYEAIAATIMREMDRGITILDGKGAYTKQDRPVLLCVIRNTEAYRLRKLVYGIDPSAFLIVMSADEVVGEGFKHAQKEH